MQNDNEDWMREPAQWQKDEKQRLKDEADELLDLLQSPKFLRIDDQTLRNRLMTFLVKVKSL